MELILLKDIIQKPISGEWGLEDLNGTGTPVLRTANFTNEGIINFENVVTRNIPFSKLKGKLLQKGDILLEKSGGSDKQPVGRVVYFDGQADKYGFNNFTSALRISDLTMWNPKYIFYALYANYHHGGTRKYENKTTGLHNLKVDLFIRNFSVPYATLIKQNEIVKKLDLLNRLENVCEVQLQKLDELVKSRFIEMFGDIHSNPKGFSYKKIGEFAKCIAGATPSTKNKDYWNNGIIPWMSSGEVNQGRIWKTEKKISQLGYDSCSTRMIPEHTVVMAMAGQGRTRGTVAIAEIPLCTNQSICSIITDDTIDADYLYTYLQFQYDNLRNISNGSAGRGGLNIKLIGQFAVLVPPLMLQKRFSLFLNECDKSKMAVQRSLDELETLKKSLMQTYFG